MQDNNVFSYTKRDYEGIRKEGIAKIPTISQGRWTDLNATDPGVIMLDYVNALVDMINYYQDHQALETFITTAKERSNIFRLAKQLSYDIPSASGARVDVKFSSTFVYNTTIKIPKYTQLLTREGLTYLTTEDAYLKIGEKEVIVECEQGQVFKKEYAGTGNTRYNPDLEVASNQFVSLTAQNIDTTSITVVDNLGRVWTPIPHIIYATELDRVYEVELNPDNSVTIKFGDGQRGVVPQETDKLTITYIVTNAENGAIGPGSIYNILTPILDDAGDYVEFSVTNEEASVGGSSAQSSTDIRELAPGAIKAQGRAITLSDFENLAKLVDGVADAKAYDINTNPDLCSYHEVKVLIIPKDITSSTSVLSKSVTNYLSQRMIPPTQLQVLTPSEIFIDIEVSVKKMDNRDSGQLEYEIARVIEEYFKNRSADIGIDFYPADLASRIVSIDGVRFIESITPTSTVTIETMAIARLGELDISID